MFCMEIPFFVYNYYNLGYQKGQSFKDYDNWWVIDWLSQL